MELAKAIQGVSNTELMRQIDKPGSENGKDFPKKLARSLSSAGAGVLKYEFPERKYRVDETLSAHPEGVRVYWERREASCKE